jgi:uncharacterized protein
VRDRAQYLTELDERRTAILKSIEEQGKLDDALRSAIGKAETKQALEDFYLPFKPSTWTRERSSAWRAEGAEAEILTETLAWHLDRAVPRWSSICPIASRA